MSDGKRRFFIHAVGDDGPFYCGDADAVEPLLKAIGEFVREEMGQQILYPNDDPLVIQISSLIMTDEEVANLPEM